MQATLFNLDLTRWEIALISWIPSLINIIIFLYVSFVFRKTNTNIFFSVFVFLLAMWQISEGFMRMSIAMETAKEWYRISLIFLLFVIPFGILFTLYFLKWTKRIPTHFVTVALFLPVMAFFILIEGKYDKVSIIKSSTVYWIANPEPSLLTWVIFLWLSLGALLIFALLCFYSVKERNNRLKQKQSLLLAIGFLIPLVGGIVVEVVFPLVLGYDDIPVAAPLLTTFSISVIIAIKKYQIFDYSPKYHWEQIIQTMNEGVLIVNNEDKIMYANEEFCNLIGYEFKEIEGRIANELFLMGVEENTNFEKITKKRRSKKANQYEIELKTKNGERIWVLANDSPYFNQNGRVIGSIVIHTNITKLKRTEDALVSKESKLRNAQSIAHIGSWELSFETNKSLWSEEACRIYGLPPSENEHSFESWISFIHPEDLELVKKEIERSHANFSDSSFYHRIVCRDKTIRYIHSISKFQINDHGFPTGLLGICHDITEQKITEQALLESEQMTRTFIDESLLSVYFVNPNTQKITYANPAFLQLLGYSKEEIGSIGLNDFVNHSKENINDRINEVIKVKKISNGERQWKRKDGQILHVLVSSFYLNRNGIETIYVAAQNITERVKAKTQIEFDQRNTKALINSTADLMWSIDKDMNLITANSSFIYTIKAMSGVELKPGDSPVMIKSFPPETLKKWVDFYNRVLSGENFTIEEYNDNPSESWSEISLYPIMQGEKVIGVSCYSRDVTASKLAERERIKITKDLMQRNVDLEQFTYIVSHNLRAPVATILGLSALLQAPKINKETRDQCLQGFMTSTKKLDETITDLYNILQTRRAINEKRGAVEFSYMVDNVKNSISDLMDKEKVIIHTDFSGVKEMTTIKSYLYSIFYNLISNSIKYRKPSDAPVIEITSSKTDNKIILKFKDNCMGIDLDLFGDKIFGLYKRFHLNIEGKGVGLYMVKTQVETLGGKISINSEVNKGTEFILEFDAA